MKKIALLLVWGLVCSPFWIIAQADCFEDVPGDVSYLEQVSENMNCALSEVQKQCPGNISEETIVELNAAAWPGSGLDYCDIWCLSDGGPDWYSTEGQLEAFENIMELAPSFAPECSINGESMILINIAVDLNIGGGESFLIADLTYACCVILDDCQADFEIRWDPSVGVCAYILTNLSTPSAQNDCGDCENPSGITTVSWSVSTIHGTGPIQWISPYTGSNDFHFSFEPGGAEPNLGFQICLRIEDCVGCTDRICKTVTNSKFCFGLTGEDDPEFREIIESDHRVFNVFPNPSNQTLNVQINEKEFDAKTSLIEMYDSQGKLVKSIKSIQEGLNSINISDLSSNIYILNLTLDGEHKHSEKIIIEK